MKDKYTIITESEFNSLLREYVIIEEELNSLLITCENYLALEERVNHFVKKYNFVYKKIGLQKYNEKEFERIKNKKEEWFHRQRYEEVANCIGLIKEYRKYLTLKEDYIKEYGDEKSRFSIVVIDKPYLVRHEKSRFPITVIEKTYLVHYDFGE